MTSRQALLAITILVASGTLAGLLVRGRVRQSWSFAAYLCSVVTCGAFFIQDRYFTTSFYMSRQVIFDVLKTAVALEMAWRVVRAFPGALRTARVFALILLASSTLLLWSVRSQAVTYAGMLFSWQPRVVACTALLFTLTALLVAWYHLPMRRLHRAIMGGFTVYLAFFATVLQILEKVFHDDTRSFWVGRIDSIAYLALLVYWARAAWARGEETMPVISVDPAPQPLPVQERAA